MQNPPQTPVAWSLLLLLVMAPFVSLICDVKMLSHVTMLFLLMDRPVFMQPLSVGLPTASPLLGPWAMVMCLFLTFARVWNRHASRKLTRGAALESWKAKKEGIYKKEGFFLLFFASSHIITHMNNSMELLLKKCCIFINTNNKLKILLHHNIKISTSYSSKKEGTIESAQVKLHRCLKYGKQGKNNVKTKEKMQYPTFKVEFSQRLHHGHKQ